MSDYITELAKRAGVDVAGMSHYQPQLDKFAELIIIECLHECLQTIADKGSHEASATDAFYGIVERFDIQGASYNEFADED